MSQETMTPLEMALVDALRSKRVVETFEAKAKAASSPQWQRYYAGKADVERSVLDYNLEQAFGYAALFLDAEAAQ